eukprot:CAMPEP_0206295882 /NCGR_PEP_ID=MMETSP0106_2-20121207/5389_1 /ASSEMBLY_ACC=CAM_ASM_000206 /TAXON_ID=81532 /ORGANISM="Acanthoeca-like sp., Strain 10tr" /LENGTH=178 /DNA_ID=CAMNT_0053726537 /DNA_START=181 /DNA_END=717 /DNA_ORIENTATION=-
MPGGSELRGFPVVHKRADGGLSVPPRWEHEQEKGQPRDLGLVRTPRGAVAAGSSESEQPHPVLRHRQVAVECREAVLLDAALHHIISLPLLKVHVALVPAHRFVKAVPGAVLAVAPAHVHPHRGAGRSEAGGQAEQHRQQHRGVSEEHRCSCGGFLIVCYSSAVAMCAGAASRVRGAR